MSCTSDARTILPTQEPLLRQVFGVLSELILLLDRNAESIEVLPTAGVSGDLDVTELTVQKIRDVETRDEFIAPVRRALDTQTRQYFEYAIEDDEVRVWYVAEISPLSRDKAIWVARDLLGTLPPCCRDSFQPCWRDRVEAELQDSEERFRATFEQAAVGIAHVRTDGSFLRVNRRFCEFLGYSPEEIRTRSYADITHPEDLKTSQYGIDRLLSGEIDTFTQEKRYLRSNGVDIWGSVTVSLVYTRSGHPDYFIAVIRDISARKQAEAALHASEERWQLAVRGNNDGIWDWNIQTNEVYFSPRWKEMLGFADDEIANHLDEWSKRVHPDDLDWVVQTIQDHLAEKTPFYITEHRVRCKDGSYRWILDRGQALWDENGDVVRMVGSHTDITARKATEAQLHRVNRTLKTLSDCNQALVRATSETELFQNICQILVTAGGYRLAWVGYVEQDADKTIRPVAQAGFDEGYLETLNLTWADTERGRGPTGTAARQGSFCVFQDIANDPCYKPWREAARKRGYASSIALPLVHENVSIGVLNLYSHLPDAFDDADIQFLEELGADLVYGIIALRTHQAHEESERRFRQLAESIDDVFWMSNDTESEILYVSPAYEKIWGRSCQSLYDNPKSYLTPIHPEDRERALNALQKDLSAYFDVEYRIVRPDGSVCWVWDRGFPIYGENGKLFRRSGIAKDITERKRAEAFLLNAKAELEIRVRERTAELALANRQLQRELSERQLAEAKVRESEKQYRTLVKNFPKGAVFLFDRDYRYTIADGVGLTELGLSREQLEDRVISDVLPAEIYNMVEPLYRAALSGETTTAEIRHVDRIYAYQALPVRNERDEVKGGMVVLQDITERKKAEAERDRLIAILEASPDIVVSMTLSGRVFYLNQAARQVWGVAPDTPLDRWSLRQGQPEWANQLLQTEGIPSALQNGSWVGETALLSCDSREIPVSQLTIAHKDAKGTVKFLSSVARDITKAKHSEARLRESERRWRSVLENVPLLVVGLNVKGCIEYVNPFFATLTGFDRETLVDKNWFETFLPASYHSSMRRYFEAILRGEDLKPHHQNPVLTRDGDKRIVSWSNTVLKDSLGQIVGSLSIGEDVTERHAIERMKDEFVSVVSHELRTPLTSIHGALNLLASRLVDPTSERGMRVVQIAADSAERLVRLVNDILALERLESGKLRLLLQSVNAVTLAIRSIEQMQVMANRARISLCAVNEQELSVTPKDLEVRADPDRVLQVLTNLLGNAIEFSAAGKTIWVSVEPITDENDRKMVQFAVRDEGRGIPPDKLEAIFERFHQVDPSDSRRKGGTGLGLTICRSIVEQHGGRIWVESTLDIGSCFYFTLPVSEGGNSDFNDTIGG
ncbi:MAG: PAS domain S-box protein [Cyanobacteria bacterium SBC]|nr:PAS domain S-box protein [Cyanobacteria bacterium SBC]